MSKRRIKPSEWVLVCGKYDLRYIKHVFDHPTGLFGKTKPKRKKCPEILFTLTDAALAALA